MSMFIFQYQKAQMELMEAAIELASAEEELRDAADNYWPKNDKVVVQGRVDRAGYMLKEAARRFTMECRAISE